MSLLECLFTETTPVQTFMFIPKPPAFSEPPSSGFPVEKPPAIVQVLVTGARGGTSRYGMFWRQLTHSTGEGGVDFHSG